jgi:hypothetical protein
VNIKFIAFILVHYYTYLSGILGFGHGSRLGIITVREMREQIRIRLMGSNTTISHTYILLPHLYSLHLCPMWNSKGKFC